MYVRSCAFMKQGAYFNLVNTAVVVTMIAGELLVLIVTWHKTYTSYKAQRGVLEGPSLVHVLLYNGGCLPEYPFSILGS